MSDTATAQQGQGDVATPAVMDNSCPFCGSDPYHRTDLGEPVAVTCCETACALWDSRDEDTVEIDRADLIAISNRLRESRILETENDRLRTLLSSSRGEQGIDELVATVDTFIRCTENGYFGKRGLKTSPIFLAMKTARERCPAGARGHFAELLSNRGPAPLSALGSVPTSLAGQVPDPEEYRDTFSGIVQGGCEACGDCDDDENGECACDRIVNELIAATQRINEEASPQPTAGGDAPTEARTALMQQWDHIRKWIASGTKSDGPRLWFETLLDDHEDALSAERARVIASCEAAAVSAYDEYWRLHKAHEEKWTAWKKAGGAGEMPTIAIGALPDFIAAALRALGQQDTGGADE